MEPFVGPAQEKALPAVNPQAHHRLQFRFPLDSFGDHLAVRLSGERDNGGQGGLFRRFPSTRETRERSTLRKSGATSRTACQSTWPVISDTTSCGASPHWRSHSAGSPFDKGRIRERPRGDMEKELAPRRKGSSPAQRLFPADPPCATSASTSTANDNSAKGDGPIARLGHTVFRRPRRGERAIRRLGSPRLPRVWLYRRNVKPA